ncbi:aldehyde dehydrogenase [Kordiimonadales bacterium JCM 17843]|nr:aldehyde dehydrogenase [Kordiimonadales bacterium JCM 17843]
MGTPMAVDHDDQTLMAMRAAMLDVLDAQRAAFRKEAPVTLETRLDRLRRGTAILVDHQDDLVEAMAADFSGRPQLMSKFTDIASAVKAFKFAQKHLRAWMKPQKRRLEFPLGLLGAKAHIEYQPKGVVGLISPWNFPVNLTFGPLAGILAAGNRVMIKPSEITPQTSDLMERLFTQYFSGEEISVVTGGADVGQAFSALPFDHLLFTGATSVGRHVMRAAAENLTPVTLELGGKSPVLVSGSADLAQMAERVVVGKMMNAGQICLAPDYMLVPKAKLAEAKQAVADAAARLYPTVKSNSDYTSIINGRHKARLLAYIEDARAKGAEITVVNPAGEQFMDEENSNILPLHLVSDVRDDMAIMQEEIFGPLLPFVPYDHVEDAINYVNSHDRPLGLYYFGSDASEERHVLECTFSGGVTVNDVVWHVGHEDLPLAVSGRRVWAAIMDGKGSRPLAMQNRFIVRRKSIW